MHECSHWFGVKFTDLDVEGWLPFLDAATIGIPAERKLTLPLPSMFPSLVHVLGTRTAA